MTAQEYKAKIDAALEEYFRGALSLPLSGLAEAMRYSLLAGGKRIRPMLVLEFCRICGGDTEAALPVACAIEMLHTYSLIHDDLPCMDDDALRRGRPTNHVVYGECTATLAGDALQAEAFGTILRCGLPADRRARCAEFLADAVGLDGMCGGQYLDMLGENKVLSEEQLTDINSRKTGALLTAATLVVKRVKGIRRAAMAPAFPNKAGGKSIICDCGANAECTPEFLLQFAIVGSLHAKKSLGLQNPRVGLLNIGTEDSKGTALQLAVYPMLQDAHEKGLINFIGNVEARQVPLGEVDVVVCDGFSGNVMLKTIEGTAMFLGSTISKMFKKNFVSKLAAMLVMKDIKAFKKLMDYREIGGTQFVGIKKPVIKAHGSSDARAFYNAVRQAVDAANNNTAEELEAALKQISVAKEKA